MQVAALHLDDALAAQAGLMTAMREIGARVVEARDLGPSLRLWSRYETLTRLQSRLRNELPTIGAPELVLTGSGDFHHITALLVARALESSGKSLTLVHFDNHPDWVKFANGVHCGSWIGNAVRLPGVAAALTVGVTSADIDRAENKSADLALVKDGRLQMFPYRVPGPLGVYKLCGREWPTIAAMGEREFVDHLTTEIATDDVYITIDKDVLRPADAVTNWDQGQLSLSFLADAILTIADEKRIVGADIVGDYSRPRYGGPFAARALKRAEAFIDQPWTHVDDAESLRVNETTNRELINLFAECTS